MKAKKNSSALEMLEKLSLTAESQFSQLDKNCYAASKDLANNILPNLSFDPLWIVTIKKPVFYRVSKQPYSPLSIAGS